ncbi:MFS transporter [Microvirga sp. VF16]|uniref:MFS transporter n=1 Tax=Microvirga sp. VF16 TaxID=2807101 RepID=UPI00193CC114|nr:MFS transporter [Microvirga sp. VF16]QRM27617.1 MFS transporter [Microvirga sp. VF16]
MREGPRAQHWLLAVRRNDTVRLLTTGQFALFSAGNGLSLIGSWMQRIACGWLVWEWTQSAFWLGLLATADFLPVVVIGPFAGVAADALDRLRLNRSCQMILTALSALMAMLLALNLMTLAVLLILVALQGCLIAVTQPARMAMVQQMVAREDVPTAVALNSMYVNLARLLGPAIAGFMILRIDIAWIFVANAAVTAFFVFTLGFVRLTPRATAMRMGSVWAQMLDGFRYVVTTEPLRVILILMLLGGALVRSISELTPAFAAQSFDVSATGLAVLSSAAAVGAIGAGLSIGAARASRLLVAVPVTWTLGAAATVALGFSTSPTAATLSAATMGYFVTHSVISTQTFVQLIVPDRMRGRALSVHGLISRGSPALGALTIGYVSDRTELSWAVLGSAIIMIIVAFILWPSARRLASSVREDDES